MYTLDTSYIFLVHTWYIYLTIRYPLDICTLCTFTPDTPCICLIYVTYILYIHYPHSLYIHHTHMVPFICWRLYGPLRTEPSRPWAYLHSCPIRHFTISLDVHLYAASDTAFHQNRHQLFLVTSCSWFPSSAHQVGGNEREFLSMFPWESLSIIVSQPSLLSKAGSHTYALWSLKVASRSRRLDRSLHPVTYWRSIANCTSGLKRIPLNFFWCFRRPSSTWESCFLIFYTIACGPYGFLIKG